MKKPKDKTPVKTNVSIVRPEATVTIVIQGQTHKLTEAEAGELHAKLGKALGIPATLIRPQPCDRAPPFRPLPPPQYWLSPTPANPRPYWDDNKIMCSVAP